MKEYFAVFRFEDAEYIVKYTCSKSYVSKEDIEDCATSYYDSTAFNENKSSQDIINDIMSSFNGVEYELIDSIYINME